MKKLNMFIKIPVYYAIMKGGKLLIDDESMREEFERKLKDLEIIKNLTIRGGETK